MISTVVLPTISDLQREIANAPRNTGVKRLHILWRGYCAFWTVMLFMPFVSGSLPAKEAGVAAFSNPLARVALASIISVVMVIVGSVFGAWVAVAMAVGTAFTLLIHAWYVRHPSALPTPAERPWHSPQINFSSTKVEGNVGGLIFAVGTVIIVAIGVPPVIWFLCAAMAAGCLVAWGLVTWHASYPKHGLPQNRIVLH
jgi:hypothetical protein